MDPQQDQQPRPALSQWMLFAVLAILWIQLAPWVIPGLRPKPKPKPNEADATEIVQDDPQVEVDPAIKGDPKVVAPAAEKPAVHPHRQHLLGSADPKSNYFLLVTLDSRGACVAEAEFNDPRYLAVDKPKRPLRILGNQSEDSVRSWQTDIPLMDLQLKKHGVTTRTVDWELLPGADAGNAEFRYRSPDGALSVRKRFVLKTAEGNRDLDPTGYTLETELIFENLTDKDAKSPPINAKYILQGPTGAPLEEPANQRMFVNLEVGALDSPQSPNSVTKITFAPEAIVKMLKAAKDNNDPTAVKTWKAPLRYAGVDVQFFTALIAPADQLADQDGDSRPDPYFAETRPIVVQEDDKHPERSDVSLLFVSNDLPVASGKTITHKFQTYLGPKRSELLVAFGADPIIDRGWSAFSFIWKVLLSLMTFYHTHFHLPYALAIVLLTVTVRLFLLPVSIKQMQSAEKMKAVAPELKTLKDKYGNEPEKFLQEQRAVYKKHGINPLAGCLPALVSLPIYVALYSTIYSAVDLRLAKFLWIPNLAAPDALFPLGFEVPWFGYTQFNLLPLLTVGLFLWQSKSTMPPATNEQEEMQQKMMTWMMVMMGFMFYKVPSGLCVYFIASSVWGICERKLLARYKSPPPQPGTSVMVPFGPETSPIQPAPPRPTGDAPLAKRGFWDQLQQLADEARRNSNPQNPGSKKR